MSANTARITLSSFLAYFVMSGMLSQAGFVTRAMADHFDQPLTEVTGLFSFYGTGVLIGSAIAVAVLDRLRTVTVVRVTTSGMAAALALLWWTDSWEGFRWWLLVAGILGGVGLAAAAFVITRSFDDRWRASMLVGTDLCFSFAGVFMSLTAAALLEAGSIWSTGYLIVAGVAALNFVLALTSDYPDPPPIATTRDMRLPAVVWICGAGLLAYTFAQSTLMLWLPSYYADALGATTAAGGAAIGSYWGGMALGQFCLFFAVLLIPLRLLVGTSLVVAMAVAAALPLLDTAALLTTFVFALGVASSGILKLVITWGSLSMAVPPPRLVSVLLLCATTGTATSPVVSAFIVEWAGVHGALVTAAIAYALLAILGIVALLHKPAAIHGAAPVAAAS